MKKQYKKKENPPVKFGGSNKRSLTVDSQTRSIQVSADNIRSFIETGLKSMRLINDSEQVFALDTTEVGEYFVHIKKEVLN